MTRNKLTQGRVQVYTGNGKGKTTASLGLAFRAVGHDFKVCILQFMKGSTVYGELETARRLAPNLTIKQVGRKNFVARDNPSADDIAMAQAGFEEAKEIVASGEYDLVILDELNCIADFGLVPIADVCALIEARPEHVELVLTGRNVPAEIIALADLVTEMREVKHYFHAGQSARKGIES